MSSEALACVTLHVICTVINYSTKSSQGCEAGCDGSCTLKSSSGNALPNFPYMYYLACFTLTHHYGKNAYHDGDNPADLLTKIHWSILGCG